MSGSLPNGLTLTAGHSCYITEIYTRHEAIPASPESNPNQPTGKYYFAGDPTQLNAAFETIRNQILRLSQ